MSDINDRIAEFLKEKQNQYDQSKFGLVQKDVTALQRFISSIIRGLLWLYTNSVAKIPLLTLAACAIYVAGVRWLYEPDYIWPVVLLPLIFFIKFDKWLFWTYVKVWNKIVNSNKRPLYISLKAIALGVFSFWLWLIAVPAFSEFVWDGSWYLATAKKHVAYLNDAPPISPHTFITKGCDDKWPCSEQDTTSYRIQSTLFNQVYSLFNHGNLFYPDYVAGAIPAVPSKCMVLTYGIRQKFLVKNLELFADLLEVECVPIK